MLPLVGGSCYYGLYLIKGSMNMPPKAARHGSNAGYQREQKTGNICDRCRKAHRVYNTQYTKGGKAKGLHYGHYDVIDHLAQTQAPTGTRRQSPAPPETGTAQTSTHATVDEPEPTTGTGEGQAEPGIASRLRDAVSRLTVPEQSYVEEASIPEYLHTVDPDPEPNDPNVPPVIDEPFVMDRAGMVLIEENLGTYLSVIGMTLEMVDPYCGPVLADNLDNIVQRWSKVIARYPAAAKLFMAKGGGVLMDWIGAIQATWPVLFAVYEHHLSKNVVTDKGRVFRVQANPNGQDVDATMPPMPDYDYSAT